MKFVRPITSCAFSLHRYMSRLKDTGSTSMSSSVNVNAIIDPIYELIDNLYKQQPNNVFSIQVTGGGTQSLNWLFSVPGASKHVVDARIPYSRSSLIESMKNKITDDGETITSCNSETALIMAKSAYMNAVEFHLTDNQGDEGKMINNNYFGVSCTATLRSNSTKKGSHRCHIGIYSNEFSKVYSYEFEKEKRTRLEEEFLCSKLILNVISTHCHVVGLKDFPENEENMIITKESCEKNDDILKRIYERKVSHALFYNKINDDFNGKLKNVKENVIKNDLSKDFMIFENLKLPKNSLIYPGSFNPLHEGHLNLISAALKKLKISTKTNENPLVVFEISALNADKPPIEREIIKDRLKQFSKVNNRLFSDFSEKFNFVVCVTSEPLFSGKSEIFKNCHFLIGADTFVRLINPKYYSDPKELTIPTDEKIEIPENNRFNMISALSMIFERKCNFIVGGRVKQIKNEEKGENDFETFDTILMEKQLEEPGIPVLPKNLLTMFTGLSEDDFRMDISSTEIRNRMKKE